jgi:proteasome lid subunit RPN8/RPN11
MNTILPNTIQAARMPPPTPPPRTTVSARRSRAKEPVLRFAPLAWLKLKMFLHADRVEVGGFGISAEDDPLYIEDFSTVKQTVTAVTVEFDDDSVADHVDRCVDAGIAPARCTRAWVHTHPASSPQPSLIDEQTFKRIFGQNDWALMIIVARGGASYVRLAFTAGPGGHVQIPLEVDWERFPQDLLDNEGRLDELFSSWLDEYGRNIHPRPELLFEHVDTAKPAGERASLSFHDTRDPLDDLYDRSVLGDDFVSWVETLEEVYP